MLQKIIIGILAAAVISVCSIWGYTVWQRTQAPPPVPVAVSPKPAEAAKADTAIAPVAAPLPFEQADGTHFTYNYLPPRDPDLLAMYDMARKIDVLRQLPEIDQLDGWLMLPRPINYVAAQCDTVNIFYARDKGDIVLCYEMLELLVRQGLTIAQANGGSARDQLDYLLANLRFLLLHETGHALIDLLDLPATGREEDAVDQLATTLMLSFVSTDESRGDIAQKLQLASNFFLITDDGQHDMASYADEHSVGAQRFFNLQCMVYGSDPDKYPSIVASGRLPAARAQRCAEESRQITRNWMRLIGPHIAPRHRMSAEEERARIEEIERKQAQNRNAADAR
jgi:hypothetical protein